MVDLAVVVVGFLAWAGFEVESFDSRFCTDFFDWAPVFYVSCVDAFDLLFSRNCVWHASTQSVVSLRWVLAPTVVSICFRAIYLAVCISIEALPISLWGLHWNSWVEPLLLSFGRWRPPGAGWTWFLTSSWRLPACIADELLSSAILSTASRSLLVCTAVRAASKPRCPSICDSPGESSACS